MYSSCLGYLVFPKVGRGKYPGNSLLVDNYSILQVNKVQDYILQLSVEWVSLPIQMYFTKMKYAVSD